MNTIITIIFVAIVNPFSILLYLDLYYLKVLGPRLGLIEKKEKA